MPANSVHHCLSGCCYIPSVNNFFWEGNKISWNWTLNLDFCHSYAWNPCTEPSRSLQTAGLVVALELAKSRLMPSYWQIRSSSWPDLAGLTPRDGVNHVCVSAPCKPSRESRPPLLHSSKHPLSGNFKEGEGQASQLNLAGWAFKFIFALCFWSCHLLYTPRFVFHRPRTSKSVKLLVTGGERLCQFQDEKKKILRLVLLDLGRGEGFSPLRCKGCRVWWYMPIIQALKRQARLKNHDFKARLDHLRSVSRTTKVNMAPKLPILCCAQPGYHCK